MQRVRTAAALVATTLLVLAAVAAAVAVTGAVRVVLQVSGTGGTALLLALLVLPALVATGFAACRWVVPRIVGGAYDLGGDVLTPRALVGLGGVAAALAMVTTSLDRPGVALVWALAIAGGPWLGASPRLPAAVSRRRLRRVRRSLRSEAGAASAEHVAVITIVAAVIAAILMVPLAPTVGAWGSYAVCTLFGGDCTHPDAPVASGEPDYACTVAESSRGGNLNGSFVVKVDRTIDYTTVTTSDGTVQLVYSNDTAAGAGIGGGLQADLYWGEGQLTLGGKAGVDGAVRFVEGEVFEWTGEDADRWADNYRLLHAATEAPSDLFVPGGRDGVVGQVLSWGGRAINDAANAAPLIDGIEYRDPEKRYRHVRGGYELSASATGGTFTPVTGSLDSAELSAALERSVGYTEDLSTGEVTVTLVASEDVTAEADVGDAGVVASWGNESVIEVRLSADGQPLEATVTTYRLDESGQDYTAVDGDRQDAFPDRRFGDGTLSGAELETPSIYEVETRLDLTDPEQGDLLTRTIAGGALQQLGVPGSYAGEAVLGPVHEAGSTSIVEYDVDDRRYGGDVDGSALIKAGGGASYLASDRQTVAAHYFDEGLDAYAPWASCVP